MAQNSYVIAGSSKPLESPLSSHISEIRAAQGSACKPNKKCGNVVIVNGVYIWFCVIYGMYIYIYDSLNVGTMMNETIGWEINVQLVNYYNTLTNTFYVLFHIVTNFLHSSTCFNFSCVVYMGIIVPN